MGNQPTPPCRWSTLSEELTWKRRPSLLPGFDCLRKIAIMVIRKAEIGEQSSVPTRFRKVRKKRVETPEIIRSRLRFIDRDCPRECKVFLRGSWSCRYQWLLKDFVHWARSPQCHMQCRRECCQRTPKCMGIVRGQTSVVSHDEAENSRH